jgi:uncharacterized membrane protein YesL
MTDNSSWTEKAFAGADTLIWIAKLNAFWLFFTVLGGVLLGVGPSTVAAAAVVRRRVRGEDVSLRQEFWPRYRAGFVRANLLLLPVTLVSWLFWSSWRFFQSGEGSASSVLAALVLVVGALFAGSVCVLIPMYVHYDLPLRAYYSKASQFAISRLPSTAILLFVLCAVGGASYLIPGLLPFLSFGAWIHLDTYLSIKFFEHNEAVLSAAAESEVRAPA